MTTRFTPRGYVSILEARSRANLRWGAEGQAKLWGLLRSGDLRAVPPDKLDPEASISPDFWKGREGERLLDATRSELDRRVVPPPVFREEDLDRGIPHPWKIASATKKVKKAHPVEQQSHSVADSRNVGGNPGKYDWERMWVEIAAQIFEGALSGTGHRDEIAFRERIMQWFENEVGSAPDLKLIRPKIKRLFNRLIFEPKTE